MPRYVAFLRGINVGGHTVKMDRLKQLFEAQGYARVSTFIASGQVVFESDQVPAALEDEIERMLLAALGYEVATFVRTDAEVAGIAAHEAFPDDAVGPSDHVYVTFLKAPPDAAARQQVLALSNSADQLAIRDREVYWLRRGNLMDATIKDADFSRALGRVPTTARNLNTLRRLAAKFPPRT